MSRTFLGAMHFLAWMVFNAFLALIVFNRNSAAGNEIRCDGQAACWVVWDILTWVCILGVPALSTVPLVRAAKSGWRNYPDLLLMTAAWAMLIYNLSFYRG